MMAIGAEKRDIKAKVFGGGKVLSYENPVHNVAADNIRVARFVLEMEDIPIIEEDVGGSFTRKVVLVAANGKVYLKKSVNSSILEKEDLASMIK
jgi:chemotaxis protein CheD